MKIPFLNSKKEQLSDIDLFDSMDFERLITSNDNLFKTIRHLENYFKRGLISKILSTQLIIDLMYQIYKIDRFDNIDRNRFVLLFFQELKNIQKSKQSEEIVLISRLSFKNFILNNTVLKKIYFIGCEFDDADLSGSVFNNCEFRGCSFKSSDLSKANFLKSKIIGCNFDSAVLDGARGIES